MTWKDKLYYLVGKRHYTKDETDELLRNLGGDETPSFGSGDHEFHIILTNEDGSPFTGYVNNPDDYSKEYKHIEGEVIIKYFPALLKKGDPSIYYYVWDDTFEKNTNLWIGDNNGVVMWDSSLTITSATHGELDNDGWNFGSVENLPNSITVNVTVGGGHLVPINSIIVKAGFTDTETGYVVPEDVIIPITKEMEYCSFSNRDYSYVLGSSSPSEINVHSVKDIPDGVFDLSVEYVSSNLSIYYSHNGYYKKGTFLEGIVITENKSVDGITQEVTFNN